MDPHQTMRLTLRTLLAYRDQVLGPRDAAILEQRLGESQTAQTISDRITYLLANPNATPLAIDAREFGLNPNDVASFLDDAMPADRVADMERKCLESSELMTEVASCHQILVQTIRAPAHVPVGLRSRMVGLWKERNPSAQTSPPPFVRRLRDDAAHPAIPRPFGMHDGKPGLDTDLESSAVEIGNIANPSTAHSRREVPAYLQQAERPWIGATLRLVVLLALLAVCVIQSLGSRERLSELLDRQSNGWSSSPKVQSPPEPIAR